jgi:tetratricopeptide (TPR) repeat protein
MPRASKSVSIEQLLQQALQYLQQQDLQQAATLYSTVLQHNPRHAEALHGLGVVTGHAGDPARAVALLRQAIAQQNNVPHYHCNLGCFLMRQGDRTGAVAAYETALQLNPNLVQAYFNLGVVYQEQGQLDKAEAAYQTVLRRQSDHIAACNNLGMVFIDRDDLEAAKAILTTALRLRPDFAEAHNNLGMVWQAQHDLGVARAAYETALRLKPDYIEALQNLGGLFQELGDLDAALACFEAVLCRVPDHAEVQWNQALLWLERGNLHQGWPAYESRWHTRLAPSRFPLPLWDGTPLTNRTILVTAEQGIGDELLFASCVPDLLQQAGHVVIECEPRLAPLFVRSFPTATVYGAVRDDHHWLQQALPLDVYSPGGSLPRFLRPTLESFPSQAGYLQPDMARRALYQQRLAALGSGLKVGLSWRSMRARTNPAQYTTLVQWADLLHIPGVQWVNLQYDEPEEELAAVQAQCGAQIHTWVDLDLRHDLDGVAALIAALDLVIAPDTTVAAVAGGVGQEVWCLTAAAGNWTSLGTAGWPWYPQMRVLRQQQYGRWDEVLAQVANDLRRLATASHPVAPSAGSMMGEAQLI